VRRRELIALLGGAVTARSLWRADRAFAGECGALVIYVAQSL